MKEVFIWLNNIYKIIDFTLLSKLLILIGIALRVYHFFLNRSLWLDESMLSNNIINRNFSELLLPLDDRQIAPIGFLFLQKISTLIFGANEYALRFIPLIAGIFSIILLYLILTNIFSEKLVFLGFCMFVFGKYLIYYSSEAKQYGLDVFVSTFSFYFLYLKLKVNRSYWLTLLYGFIGALLIWISHISIIVLASIGIIITVKHIFVINKKEIINLVLVLTLWISGFLIYYFYFIHSHEHQQSQTESFTFVQYFPPTNDLNEMISWLLLSFKSIMEYPFGAMSGHILLVIISLAIFYIIRHRLYTFFVFLIPVIIHMLISFKHLYPFGNRFILYTSVGTIVLVLFGFKQVISFNRKIGIPIILFIFVLMMARPIRRSIISYKFEEIRPAIEYISQRAHKKDLVYVYAFSKPAFDFYRSKCNMSDIKIYYGHPIRSGFENFDMDFKEIQNYKRTWILMTHFEGPEKEYILNRCRPNYNIIEEFNGIGSFVCLLETN